MFDENRLTVRVPFAELVCANLCKTDPTLHDSDNPLKVQKSSQNPEGN